MYQHTAERTQLRPQKNANPLIGTWTYRSFFNDPDMAKDFNNLRLAAGKIVIQEADNGVFAGRFIYSDTYQLNLSGATSYGNPFTVRFQGVGDTSGSLNHIYDYTGYLIPAWPNGVNQRLAIVGTLVRTVTHGQSQAGVVGSWIAVKNN